MHNERGELSDYPNQRGNDRVRVANKEKQCTIVPFSKSKRRFLYPDIDVNPLEPFKAAQKHGWAHFAPLDAYTTPPAARLVKRSGIRTGYRVLDVACGAGVVATTAARLGARVTGLDLTPELLERARENSSNAGVEIEWREGDVEELPFDDAVFDAVVSQTGHMFAPRPDVAVAEMLRVLKPGGAIAFSTWAPGLVGGRSVAC